MFHGGRHRVEVRLVNRQTWTKQETTYIVGLGLGVHYRNPTYDKQLLWCPKFRKASTGAYPYLSQAWVKVGSERGQEWTGVRYVN